MPSLNLDFEDDTQHNSMRVENNLAILASPLYPGCKTTVRDAIVEYVGIFTEKSCSKSTYSAFVQSFKKMLPDNNLLPDSFDSCHSLISHELVSMKMYCVCVNECMLIESKLTTNSRDATCSVCNETLYKPADSLGRRYPRKAFTYSSVKSHLNNLFKCTNIAQVMQEAGGCGGFSLVNDLTETRMWSEWLLPPNSNKVILGLNTDGMNPYHGSGIQYSMWPIILCVMNLPARLRNKNDALILTGIVPSRDSRRTEGVEPDLSIYVDLLVSELISLSSTHIYSAYRSAPVAIKVELLMFMMDFQAYAKFFKMSGANAYFSCFICKMKATRLPAKKMALISHAHYKATPKRNFIEEVMNYFISYHTTWLSINYNVM